MEMVIHSVVADSPAEAAGLRAGDRVVAVNGRRDLEDLFDYQFEVTDTAYLEFTVARTDNTEEILPLEKPPLDDPGIVFTSPLFTPIKTCNNACPFCFIDQQPEGLRPSLYVKDDDWRLSYFTNTYITLTNLTPHDRKRIETIRPGPLYVSVHSTTPEVREQMLQNRKHAGRIMDELKWLADLGVPFHCQVVLCPGINDGEVLTRTLNDLYTLHPEAMSVAVIPVGLTQYRGDLPQLQPVSPEDAARVIDTVEAFRQNCDNPDFVFLSDEFYFKADRPLPSYEEYGDFPQLDDGVGTVRTLLEDFFHLAPELPRSLSPPRNLLVVTGKLAAMSLQPVVTRLNEIDGLYVDCVAVESKFWGQSVDVAGLITGQDIIETLKTQDTSGYDFAVIPSVMLKEDTELFLDGKTVTEVSAELGLPFRILTDPYDAEAFLETIEVPVSA